MKKFSIWFIALVLSGCASTHTTTATSSRLGNVTDKETIVTQTRHVLPIDVGVGFGGGGWGVNLGLGRLFGQAQGNPQKMFQYKIKVGSNESLTLQSEQDFNIGACLTVWERIGDHAFPKIQANPTCSTTTKGIP